MLIDILHWQNSPNLQLTFYSKNEWKIFKNCIKIKLGVFFNQNSILLLGLFCFYKQSVMFFSFTYNIDLLVYFLNKY